MGWGSPPAYLRSSCCRITDKDDGWQQGSRGGFLLCRCGAEISLQRQKINPLYFFFCLSCVIDMKLDSFKALMCRTVWLKHLLNESNCIIYIKIRQSQWDLGHLCPRCLSWFYHWVAPNTEMFKFKVWSTSEGCLCVYSLLARSLVSTNSWGSSSGSSRPVLCKLCLFAAEHRVFTGSSLKTAADENNEMRAVRVKIVDQCFWGWSTIAGSICRCYCSY